MLKYVTAWTKFKLSGSQNNANLTSSKNLDHKGTPLQHRKSFSALAQQKANSTDDPAGLQIVLSIIIYFCNQMNAE